MTFTKETAKRTLRTFLQAILAYIAVNLVAVDFSNDKAAVKSAIIGLCVSALSAGISAVMNLEKKDRTVFEEVPEDELTTEDEV